MTILETVQYAERKPADNPHHHTLYFITTEEGYNEVKKEKGILPEVVDFITRSKYKNLLRKAYYRTNVRKTYLVLSDEADNPELGKPFRNGSVFKMNHKYSYVFYAPKTGERLRFWTQHCPR